MINIIPTPNDDLDFISKVLRFLNENLIKYKPTELYLIQIDNWFGHKWLKFSGKRSGLAAIWKQRTTVPPFIPDRVLKETFYIKGAEEQKYNEKALIKPLHQYYPADGRTLYYIDEVTESDMFLWFSGKTKVNKSGSLMIYINTPETHEQWYASFVFKDEWKLHKTKKINPENINTILNPE